MTRQTFLEGRSDAILEYPSFEGRGKPGVPRPQALEFGPRASSSRFSIADCSRARGPKSSPRLMLKRTMSDVILYVDTSDVGEGALDELEPAVKQLVDFVEANEPRLIAYNIYFSEDGTRMTVVSMHPDSAS